MSQSATTLLLVVVLLWVLINIRATRSVLHSEAYPHHKMLMIIGIWIAPFVVAVRVLLQEYSDARSAKRSRDRDEALPPGFTMEVPPEELRVGDSPGFSVRQHSAAVNDFPLMDWKALDDWAHTVGEQHAQREAFAQGQRAWLLHMRSALGPHYRLYESGDAYVLSPLENRVVLATADFMTRARNRVRNILDNGVARLPDDEKSILLILDDDDLYYRYVSCYYPDQGEFSFSGGLFIPSGCAHFVTKVDDLSQMEPVIAHELTHAALAHLNLPVWLDEGLAVNTERLVIGGTYSMSMSSQELRRRQLAFWGDAEIQEFWTGRSFERPDEGSPLSYELARIMVELLNKDWGAFVQFVLNAQHEDAGAAAAQKHLGVELGAFVSALLEREPQPQWSPTLT